MAEIDRNSLPDEMCFTGRSFQQVQHILVGKEVLYHFHYMIDGPIAQHWVVALPDREPEAVIEHFEQNPELVDHHREYLLSLGLAAVTNISNFDINIVNTDESRAA